MTDLIKDTTLIANGSNGTRLAISIHGQWRPIDIVRASAHIALKPTCGAEPSAADVVRILSDAEASAIRVMGPPIVLPKPEPEAVRAPAKPTNRRLTVTFWAGVIMGFFVGIAVAGLAP